MSERGADKPKEGGINAAKLLRACGGCLGAKRRDVEDCDKLGGVVKRALIPRCLIKTRRTETSKYPEERKSTETPLVVASERGLAQTEYVKADMRCVLGVVGLVPRPCPVWRQLQSWALVEVEWKLAPQRVIVP
jgi:hypothetical protein